MWLSGMQYPDFRTISDFRKIHRPEIEDIFIQIVRIAMQMGLVSLGHISIDGSKIKANASKNKAITRGTLKKEIAKIKEEITFLLNEADDVDKENDDNEQRSTASI